MGIARQFLGVLFIFFLVYFAIVCPRKWSNFNDTSPSGSPQRDSRPQTNTTCMNVNDVSEDGDEDLGIVLSRASRGNNKTVIITVVNKAYVETDMKWETSMLDLFINSFWIGEGTRPLINQLLVVAVDKAAYDRCKFLRLNCYRLRTETDGVDLESEKMYMSPDFIKMMWTRTKFLLDVLERGYNFIFTDTDVMWLRNPLERLSNNGTEDIQFSIDFPHLFPDGVNTGFYHVRSNNRTISLFETWYGSKDNSTGLKEQDVLQSLLKNGIMDKLHLRVIPLDTLYFTGFCLYVKDFKAVATVHANCCQSIEAKLGDLKAVHRDWMRFKKVGENQWTSHKACGKLRAEVDRKSRETLSH